MKVTSDAGLLTYREIDDVFGLTDMAASELSDERTRKNMQHSIRKKLYYYAIYWKTSDGTEYS